MFLIARSFTCALVIVTVLGAQVYLEKAQLISFNPKYLFYAFVNVSRHGRGTTKFLNLEINNKETIANNITVTVTFFEYRWNRYYRSIVQFHHKLCDFFEKDVYIGAAIGAAGLKCPVKPGKHPVMNLSPHFENFPSPLPFDKARVEFNFNVSHSDESVAKAVVYVSIKNELKKKRT